MRLLRGAAFAGPARLEAPGSMPRSRAADEIIPEIGNIERRETVAQKIKCEDQRLRPDRRPKHGRAADLFQKKCHEENSQHHAVKNRANDVDGLDQIFREAGEQREGDGDKSPERGEPFRGADIARLVVRGERTEMPPEVNGRGGAERVEFAGL